jgi:hypothetical protein
MLFADPSRIDISLDSRAATFENPTGQRGAGGTIAGGRKGSPARVLAPGERVVLMDAVGPGTVRHIWLTVPPGPPEVLRALTLEVFYDGHGQPSVCVPVLDFFGLAHGRPAAYDAALMSVHEGRGYNSYVPMPFRDRLRIEFTNGSARRQHLFYQVDYTLGPVPDDAGYLHASFRREHPTTMRRDFVIAEGLRGPGRFLGCVVGVRVLDEGTWYGEGEVKCYIDGDGEHPTICGTGLEDYIGSAWGLGQHAALYAGAPNIVQREDGQPAFVSFYRWHLPDPIVFRERLRVTIQQIGYAFFGRDDGERFEAYAKTHPAAGLGWERDERGRYTARGIAERVDDYCATAFVYCREPQPVPRVDVALAVADIGRIAGERPLPFERVLTSE